MVYADSNPAPLKRSKEVHIAVARLEGGTVVTDPDTVRAAYQLGDFRYQWTKRDGTLSPIRTCTNPNKLEQIANRASPENPVTIKPLR